MKTKNELFMLRTKILQYRGFYFRLTCILLNVVSHINNIVKGYSEVFDIMNITETGIKIHNFIDILSPAHIV